MGASFRLLCGVPLGQAMGWAFGRRGPWVVGRVAPSGYPWAFALAAPDADWQAVFGPWQGCWVPLDVVVLRDGPLELAYQLVGDGLYLVRAEVHAYALVHP